MENFTRSFIVCIVIMFLAASCAPQTVVKEDTAPSGQHVLHKTETEVSDEVSDAIQPEPEKTEQVAAISPSAVETQAPRPTADTLEQELRDALKDVSSASVRREENSLIIVLDSDAIFGTSGNVTPVNESELSRIAGIMTKYSGMSVRVAGHTDSKGSNVYNMKLSRQRTEAIKKILTQAGADPSQIETAAMGESKPVASNQTTAGRKLNRRVEIEVKY